MSWAHQLIIGVCVASLMLSQSTRTHKATQRLRLCVCVCVCVKQRWDRERSRAEGEFFRFNVPWQVTKVPSRGIGAIVALRLKHTQIPPHTPPSSRLLSSNHSLPSYYLLFTYFFFSYSLSFCPLTWSLIMKLLIPVAAWMGFTATVFEKETGGTTAPNL